MAAPAAHAPGLRVVSLLPSATDTLVALGLAQLLIGRTHECEGAAHAAVCTESKLGEVGELSAREVDSAASASASALWLASLDGDVDTNELSSLEWGLSVHRTHLAQLARLQPDLILTQVQTASGALSLDAVLASLRRHLRLPGLRLLQLEAEGLESAFSDAQRIADAVGCHDAGVALLTRSRARLAALAAASHPPPRVAVVQWSDPLFIAGGWIPTLLRAAGCVDAFGGSEGPEGGAALQLEPAQMLAAQPQVLLFAICGCGIDEAASAASQLRDALGEATWGALPAVAGGWVYAVDARRLFSRAGPHDLAETAEVMALLCHPEAGVVLGGEGRGWRRVDGARRAAEAGEAREMAYL